MNADEYDAMTEYEGKRVRLTAARIAEISQFPMPISSDETFMVVKVAYGRLWLKRESTGHLVTARVQDVIEVE